MGGSRTLLVRRLLSMLAATATACSLTLVAVVPASAITTVLHKITVVPGSGTPIEGVTEGRDTPNDPTPTVGKFTDNLAQPSGTCDTSNYSAVIHWGDSQTSQGDITCEFGTGELPLTTGTFDVSGFHRYADSGSYTISLVVTEGDVSGSGDTDTATIDDATILGEGHDVKGTEGQTINAVAIFLDEGQSSESIDSGLTASIDWGDGSTSSGTVAAAQCDCEANVQVTGSHTYDARATSYAGSITLSDDGGSAKTVTFAAAITDAALTAGTAKSVTMTAAQASTATVASFTDAAGAQAAAADFTASIKWGDGTTSNGTVSKTGSGAFDVSGTHTYTTAGTKSLTITVTDEEGQSVSMSATVTVPALPTTGHPSTPVNPISPIAAWLGLLLAAAGFTAIAIGVRRTRLG